MQSPRFWFPQFVPLLFVPAGLGLLFHSATATTAAERLLGVAIALFCPELARMAHVDLENIATILRHKGYIPSYIPGNNPRENGFASVMTVLQLSLPEAQQPGIVTSQLLLPQPEDSRLNHFYKITISTIVLEIIGFYLALLSLQGGALIIIFSQIWFNILAGVQLAVEGSPAVVPFGVAERKAVLVANAIGFGLICCWPIEPVRIWLALGLLVLIALFLIIKYGILSLRSRPIE